MSNPEWIFRRAGAAEHETLNRRHSLQRNRKVGRGRILGHERVVYVSSRKINLDGDHFNTTTSSVPFTDLRSLPC